MKRAASNWWGVRCLLHWCVTQTLATPTATMERCLECGDIRNWTTTATATVELRLTTEGKP